MATIAQGYKERCFKQGSNIKPVKSLKNTQSRSNSVLCTQSITKSTGLCCVCHRIPNHSRTYYGRLFCISCFHKYIWNPSPMKKDFVDKPDDEEQQTCVKIN